LHTNVFDRVANFIAETDLLRQRVNQNKRRRNIGVIDLVGLMFCYGPIVPLSARFGANFCSVTTEAFFV